MTWPRHSGVRTHGSMPADSPQEIVPLRLGLLLQKSRPAVWSRRRASVQFVEFPLLRTDLAGPQWAWRPKRRKVHMLTPPSSRICIGCKIPQRESRQHALTAMEAPRLIRA